MSDPQSILGIPVVVQRDGDQVVVMDYMIHMYGVDDSLESAVADYKSVVWEYYQSLTESESILGNHLKEHLAYLRGRLN